MRDIRKVTVIGSGTMGQGIAQCAAQAGFDVALSDAAPDALSRGVAAIRSSLDRLVEKERIKAP